MKVLLISVNNEKDPCPAAPIGAAYITSALKKKCHEVRILDLCFVENDHAAIRDVLNGFAPDVIGISVRNIDNLTFGNSKFYMPRIRGIVDFIKRNISVPVIVGGSGFSIFPEEVLKYLDLETGIIGEGESAFAMLLDALESGRRTADISNLCYIKNGEFHSNRPAYDHAGLLPDRSLLNNRMYLELGGMANIQSKRGCPFKCAYCTYPNIDGNLLRLREPAEVVEEMKAMQEDFGADHIFFVDDIFNFPEEHAVSICEEMIRNDLKIDWTCFAAPKGITVEFAGLMKRAGCKGVEFGSDAGSERTLKGLGKHFSPDDIARATECCRTTGLPNAHYIIIGGPGENSTTLNETVSLFETIKPNAIIALIGLRIYPNTELHKKAVEDGVISMDTDLLEPVFYLTPEIETGSLIREVSGCAMKNGNWIAPALNVRCDAGMMSALRRRGKRGPLWNML